MKPDWKYAPDWAKFLAQDEDGSWFWYEAEPIVGLNGRWTNQQRTRYEQAFVMGPIEVRP